MLAAKPTLCAVACVCLSCGGGPGGKSNPSSAGDAGASGVAFVCTGALPANASMCPGADRGLTSDMPRVVTVVCETTPCSYVCDAGYTLGSDLSCIANPTVTAGKGFVDNGDGTVTDLGSGLVWLKDANCSGLMTASDAAAWALQLTSGACGLQSSGGWRLPTPSELMALASDLAAGNPFVGVEDGRYWTSFSEGVGVFGAVDMLTVDYADLPWDSLFYTWPVRLTGG